MGVNKNELEILSLMETDDFALSTISQTNAAALTVTPRISGNYNGLFIKTTTHIVPLPSIINTEPKNGTPFTLDSENIKSMVTHKGLNIPKQGNVATSTGQLTNLVLTGALNNLNKDSTNADKAVVIEMIKAAYINETQLNTDGIIEYITNIGIDEATLAAVFDTNVLNETTTVVIPSSFTCGDTVSALGETYTTILGPDGNCWTSQNMRHGTMLANGAIMPSDVDTIEKWCYGNNENICNTDGGFYTWSEAMGFDASCDTTSCTQSENITKSVCGQLGTGWSLPTNTQWTALTIAGATGWNLPGNKLSGIVSILAGSLNGSQSITGFWWLATEVYDSGSELRRLEVGNDIVHNDFNNKEFGFSVVCIKN